MHNSDPDRADTTSVASVFIWGERWDTPSIFGRIRKCRSLTTWEIFLFLTTCLTVAVSFCFSIESLIFGDSEEKVFAVVVLIHGFFILLYLFHGVFRESFFELLWMSLSLAALSSFFVVNYFVEFWRHLNEFDLVITFLSPILTLVSVALGFFQVWRYCSSPRLIISIVGARIKNQRMCCYLYLAQSLLVFDNQWTGACLILFFQQGFHFDTSYEIVLVILGPVIILLWALAGYFGMRWENKGLSWTFVALGLVMQPVYIVCLCVHSGTVADFKIDVLNCTLYISVFVSILSHFTLAFVVLLIVIPNYGKGLAKEVYGDRMDDSELFATTANEGFWPTGIQHSVDENESNEGQPLLTHPRTSVPLRSSLSLNSTYSSIG